MLFVILTGFVQIRLANSRVAKLASDILLLGVLGGGLEQSGYGQDCSRCCRQDPKKSYLHDFTDFASGYHKTAVDRQAL